MGNRSDGLSATGSAFEEHAQFLVIAHEHDHALIDRLESCFPVILIDDHGDVSTNSPHLASDVDALVTLPVGALALSLDTHARLLNLLPHSALLMRLGIDHVRLVSPAPQHDQSQSIKNTIIASLLTGRAASIERNVGLMRAVSVLRKEMADMQASFSRLETFVESSGLAARQLAAALPPQIPERSVLLRNGHVLVQRLPGSSAGLTDVAIHIGTTPMSDGILQCLLQTDDGEEQARWSIPAVELPLEWLRLSLPVALGPDARTIFLHCSWTGERALNISHGAPHPDQRFHAMIGEYDSQGTLALKTWRFVPGCAAPLTMDGRLNDGHPPKIRSLPLEMLKQGENLNPENPHFHFRDDHAGLLVHPMGEGVSVALLRHAVPKGVRRISVNICTVNPAGPRVEYAAAVASAKQRASSQYDLPAFLPEHNPPWQAIAAMEESQIHLDLGQPGADPLDLYLMTRLPPDATFEFGWAIFSNVQFEF